MEKETTEVHELIAHQKTGDAFSGVYYIQSVFVKKTVNGKDYSDFALRDKSGVRGVKYWGVISDVAKGDFVFVAAHVEEYQGNPSIIAKNIEKVDAPVDLSNYIPIYDAASEHAGRFDELRKYLAETEESIGEDRTAGMLVDEVYGNATFFSKFISAPGSARPHYGKQGGLLASTVRVANACMEMAGDYGLDEQEQVVLLASALLFRIGAIDAFEFKDCIPAATKRGILLGIGNLTMTRVTSALKRVVASLSKAGQAPSQEIVVRILHAVASYDSANVLPMTKEAMVLHAAYKADAEMVDAMDFIAADQNLTEDFTAYDPSTRRQYYTGERKV